MTNHRREFDPPLDDVLREMASRARTCVAAIDDALSDGREFILGDTFTAADICLGVRGRPRHPPPFTAVTARDSSALSAPCVNSV